MVQRSPAAPGVLSSPAILAYELQKGPAMLDWNSRTSVSLRFADPREAGQRLAAAVAPLAGPDVVVVGIPRGGLVVAADVAARLGLPLFVSFARKLPVPTAPQLAFGAVEEDGRMILNADTVALAGPDDAAIESVRRRVQGEIESRRALYHAPPLAPRLRGRTVVLVDDGLATGLTMEAAVLHARRCGARSIIVATPCASSEAASRFQKLAEHFVALVIDPDFRAVGAYYEDFSPVTDGDVMAILEAARTTAPCKQNRCRHAAKGRNGHE